MKDRTDWRLCPEVCPNQPTVWTPTSGPRYNGMRCFCPGLVTFQRGICKSPMEHDRQSPVSGLQTTCPVGPDCPSVEVTTLVPTTSGNGSEDTSPSAKQKEPNPTNTQCQPTGHKPTTIVVWLSGRSFKAKSFRKKLQDFSYPLGDPNHLRLTTRCSQSGPAGVVKGILIPFQEI